MEKRYNALRTIGTIFKVLGIILGIFAILSIVAFCAMSVIGGAALTDISQDLGYDIGLGVFGGILGGIFSGFVLLLTLGLPALFLYGYGEMLFLFLSVEENTRATALQLQAQARPPEQPPAQ
jgi:hypothetical protein